MDDGARASISGHLAFACWLHVLAGLFVVGCVATIWIAAAALSSTFAGTFIPGLVALFGKPIAVVLIAFASIQLLCAVASLLGYRWPRYGMFAVSVPLLFVFPVGTIVAGYTLFALTRSVAEPPAIVVNAPIDFRS